MKHFILAAALILPSLAFADTTSTVTGQNQSQAASTNVVQPAQIINTYGASSVKTSQQAPSQSFSASFSPDSCATGAGGTVGTFPVAIGIAIPVSPDYCVKLRVVERLEQSSAIESRLDVKDGLRDAAYDVLGSISPEVHDILVKHMVIADDKQRQATAASDQPKTYAVAQP